jgi:hypothetical protein
MHRAGVIAMGVRYQDRLEPPRKLAQDPAARVA